MADNRVGLKDFKTLVSRARDLGYQLYGYDRDYKTREELKKEGRKQFNDWNNSVTQGRQLYSDKGRKLYTSPDREEDTQDTKNEPVSLKSYNPDLIFQHAGMFIYDGNKFEWQPRLNLDEYLPQKMSTSLPVLKFEDGKTDSFDLSEFANLFSDYKDYKVSNTFFLYRIRTEGSAKVIYPIIPFYRKGSVSIPFTCDSTTAAKFVNLLTELAKKSEGTVNVNSSNFMKPPAVDKLSTKTVGDLLGGRL